MLIIDKLKVRVTSILTYKVNSISHHFATSVIKTFQWLVSFWTFNSMKLLVTLEAVVSKQHFLFFFDHEKFRFLVYSLARKKHWFSVNFVIGTLLAIVPVKKHSGLCSIFQFDEKTGFPGWLLSIHQRKKNLFISNIFSGPRGVKLVSP